MNNCLFLLHAINIDCVPPTFYPFHWTYLLKSSENGLKRQRDRNGGTKMGWDRSGGTETARPKWRDRNVMYPHTVSLN